MSREEGARHTGSPLGSPRAVSKRLDRALARRGLDRRIGAPLWNRYHDARQLRSQDRNPARFACPLRFSDASTPEQESDSRRTEEEQKKKKRWPRRRAGSAGAVIFRFAAREHPEEDSPRLRLEPMVVRSRARTEENTTKRAMSWLVAGFWASADEARQPRDRATTEAGDWINGADASNC